jgi:hypothetical protein
LKMHSDLAARHALCRRMIELGEQFPWVALMAVLETLEYGATVYAENPLKWRTQSAAEHEAHRAAHLVNHALGDQTEEHVPHAITRGLMMGEMMLAAAATAASVHVSH